RLVGDSTSAFVDPKIVATRIILGNKGVTQSQSDNRVITKSRCILKFTDDPDVTRRIHYETVCNVGTCAAGPLQPKERSVGIVLRDKDVVETRTGNGDSIYCHCAAEETGD